MKIHVLNKSAILILTLGILFPSQALALDMPANGSELAEMSGVSAKAYAVMDIASGQMLIQKNADVPRTPASLTKLVTALVVLDTKPKLGKAVTMSKQDQVVGSCSQGGGCIKSTVGVKFTVDGLFHAALMPSANNAAAALARSTGLSVEQFAVKMNEKAKSLGALNTKFNEPTGMDPTNVTTAADYAKIIAAAFKNDYLRNVAQKTKYTLKSSNNSKYNQTLKNTDKLLTNPDVKILIAKTGYLEESQYNFGSVIKYHDRDELAVVVLGEERQALAFSETALLAKLAEDARVLAIR